MATTHEVSISPDFSRRQPWNRYYHSMYDACAARVHYLPRYLPRVVDSEMRGRNTMAISSIFAAKRLPPEYRACTLLHYYLGMYGP